MRILFYGACHATALRRIFQRFGPAGLSTDLVSSVKLIEQGTPFPYDTLPNYDCVVYSTILQRGDQGTTLLGDICRDHGVQTIAVPPIEWAGYFPGMTRIADHRGYRCYPELFRYALDYQDYADFETYVTDAHVIEDAPARLQRANTVLQRIDELGDARIGAASLLEKHYREQRMMLTPTHPSRAFYSLLVRRLEEILGLRLDPSFHYGQYEPQDDAKEPLLPGAMRALGLYFSDSEYRSHALFRDRRARSLREWLQMYFAGARGAFTYEARQKLFLKRRPVAAAMLPPEDRVLLRAGEIVLGLPLEAAPGTGWRILVLGGNDGVPVGSEWYLYPKGWQRYGFKPPQAERKESLIF
jgi:hypothetical protein